VKAAAALVLLAAFAVAQEPSSCVTNCHGAETKAFADSIHKNSMRCVDCHGGDPTALRDEAKSHSVDKGFVGKIAHDKIPGLCGRCHSDPIRMHASGLKTDQLEHYKTSAHGKAVLDNGNLEAAVCTDCHGTHLIRPAHDPLAPTAPANQPRTCGKCHADAGVVTEFNASVHGRALADGLRGAPACADCHGAHGATPPGVRDIVQVCGKCHTNTAAHFRAGPHAGDEMNCASCHDEQTREYRLSGCTACHGAHAITEPDVHLYEGDAVGRCAHCHRDTGRAQEVAAVILKGTRELEDALRESLDEISGAKKLGVFLDNEKIYLRESQRALVSVRPLSHSMDAAAVREHLEAGLRRQDRTREMITKRKTVLRDRKLLLVALSAILLLLTALLRMKLKAVRELS